MPAGFSSDAVCLHDWSTERRRRQPVWTLHGLNRAIHRTARRVGASPSPDRPPTLSPTYDDLDPKGQDHHDQRQEFVRSHRTFSSWTPAG